MSLSEVPLTRAARPVHCHEPGCRAVVTEYRWSPYFCPTCDLARMERIDKSLAAIEARFAPPVPESATEGGQP